MPQNMHNLFHNFMKAAHLCIVFFFIFYVNPFFRSYVAPSYESRVREENLSGVNANDNT